MFTVYMMLFEDGYLYTGMSSNSFCRAKEHFKTKGPGTIIFRQKFGSREDARQREKQIKGWTRAKKLARAHGDIEALELLSKRRGGRPRSIPGSYESPP